MAEEWIARGRPERALGVLGDGSEYEAWCRSGSAGVRAGRAWQEASLALGRRERVDRVVADSLARAEDRAEALVLAARLAPDDGKALALLDRAEGIDPDLEWPPYGRGVILAKEGARRRALEALDEALERAERFFEALRARALLRERAADFDGAADDARRALRVRPGDVEMALHLASIEHRDLMRLGRAEGWYRRALDLEPGRPDALLGLAACLEEQGELERAERLYLHVAPREPLAWFDLGLLYDERLDRPERALEAFRRFVETDPPSDSAAAHAQLERWLYAPLRIRDLEERLGVGAER